MSNLSNINGKFVVEQTTGYVGVGTTDPNYPIEVLNASAEIALNASGGSIYRLQSDSASNFIIRKAGVGDRLVINSAGNATFAGNISGVRGFFNSGATNVVATFTSTDGTATLKCVDPTGNVEFGASGNSFVVQPAGGVAQLTVGETNSTFGGGITSGGYFRTAAANTDYSLITRDGTGNALFVQNAQSNANQPIANFRYGSAAVNQGTPVLQVSKDNSHFVNCNVGIGTAVIGTRNERLYVDGEVRQESPTGAGDNVRGGLGAYDTTTGNGAGVGGQLVLGYRYSGNSYTEGAIIKMYKENGNSGEYGSGLRFQVRNHGDNLSTKMTLDPSGNVGIGRTPDVKILDLQSTSGLALRFYNSATFKAGIEVVTTAGQMIGSSAVNDLAIRSQSNILFATGGNTERMRITSTGAISVGSSGTAYGAAGEVLTSNGNAAPSWQAAGGGGAWTTTGNDIYNSNSGNVGIGVTSPGAKLEIDGDVIYKNVNQYQTTVARTIEFTCYLQGSNTYTLIQFTQPSTNAQVMATIEFGGIITGNNSDRFAGSNSSITKYNGFSWYSSFVELGYVGNTSYRPQVIWDFGRLKLNVKSSTDNLFRIRLTYRGFGAAPTKTYPN